MERRAYEVFTAQAICSTIAELQLQKIKEENHAGGSYTENDCPCFQVLKADRRCTEKSHEDVSEYSGWFYISCPEIWKSLFISAFCAYRIIISVETLVKTATHRRCGKVLTNIPTEMDKSSSTKEAISEYRNSDFQFSGSAISSRKNIQYLERQKAGQQATHGKMSVKKLVGQGMGASSIEVTDNNIKSFERVARKYNVDFAVKKDKTVEPPKYMVFFKSKDADVITQAFKEFVKVNEKKRGRVSVKEKLAEFRELLGKDKNRERAREHQKDRGQSL